MAAEVTNLQMSITDVSRAQYSNFHKAWELEATSVPKAYMTAVVRPFQKLFENLGYEKVKQLMSDDPQLKIENKNALKNLIPEVAEAILQRNHEEAVLIANKTLFEQGKPEIKTPYHDLLAFQAVVDSIYFSIFSRSELKIMTPLPPIAKWGKAEKGPYTYPISSTHKVAKLYAGIVNLPVGHQNGGILAWSSLGHEIGGHNFLRANSNIIKELGSAICESVLEVKDQSLKNKDKKNDLATFWKSCAEEMACDILGVLNIGPIAILGFLGHLKGIRKKGKLRTSKTHPHQDKARTMKISGEKTELNILDVPKSINFPKRENLIGKSSQEGSNLYIHTYFPKSEPHPIDLLRPYAMLAVLDYLNPKIKEEWEERVLNELKNESDVNEITVECVSSSSFKILENKFPKEDAILTGQSAASAVLNTKLVLCIKSY